MRAQWAGGRGGPPLRRGSAFGAAARGAAEKNGLPAAGRYGGGVPLGVWGMPLSRPIKPALRNPPAGIHRMGAAEKNGLPAAGRYGEGVPLGLVGLPL